MTDGTKTQAIGGGTNVANPTALDLPATQQGAAVLGSMVNALAPLAVLMPPKAQLAFALAQAAMNAITLAAQNSEDVTDEALAALYAQGDANKADDLAAQREARERGDTTGDPVQ